MELLPLLLAALADAQDASKARLQELRGRLGLTTEVPRDARSRVLAVLRAFPAADEAVRELVRVVGQAWHTPVLDNLTRLPMGQAQFPLPEKDYATLTVERQQEEVEAAFETLLDLLPFLAATSLQKATKEAAFKEGLFGEYRYGGGLKIRDFLTRFPWTSPLVTTTLSSPGTSYSSLYMSNSALRVMTIDPVTKGAWTLWVSAEGDGWVVRETPDMVQRYARGDDANPGHAAAGGKRFLPYGWVPGRPFGTYRFLSHNASLSSILERQLGTLRKNTQDWKTATYPWRPRDWEDLAIAFLLIEALKVGYASTVFANWVTPHLGVLHDWVEATHPANLLSMPLPEALDASATWHATFKTAGYRGIAPLGKEDEVVHTYPDGGSIVRLQSRRGLENEGEAMNHCVGSHLQDVRQGRARIFSYRDEKNVPQATVELPGQLPKDFLRVSDIEGPDNQTITDRRAAARLGSFLRAYAKRHGRDLRCTTHLAAKLGRVLFWRSVDPAEQAQALRTARAATESFQRYAGSLDPSFLFQGVERLLRESLSAVNSLDGKPSTMAPGLPAEIRRNTQVPPKKQGDQAGNWSLHPVLGDVGSSDFVRLYIEPPGGGPVRLQVEYAWEGEWLGNSSASWLDAFIEAGILVPVAEP